jgi:hypothetical protein
MVSAERPSGSLMARCLDGAGATASLVCAVHCALMPVAVSLLPLAGLAWLADETVERALVAASVSLGILSLCMGYRLHRSRRLAGWMAVGVGMLAVGRIAEEQEAGASAVALVVCGGLVLTASQLFNRRLCQACRRCSNREAGEEPVT